MNNKTAIYSTGQAAEIINVHRDRVSTAIRSKVPGSPRPSVRIGRFYAFNQDDVVAVYDWLKARGIKVTRPEFSESTTMLQSTS